MCVMVLVPGLGLWTQIHNIVVINSLFWGIVPTGLNLKLYLLITCLEWLGRNPRGGWGVRQVTRELDYYVPLKFLCIQCLYVYVCVYMHACVNV